MKGVGLLAKPRVHANKIVLCRLLSLPLFYFLSLPSSYLQVDEEAGAARTVVAVVVRQQMRGRRLGRRRAEEEGVEDI
jgi:hypothetical protein